MGKTKTSFQPNNITGQRHGGEAAVKAIQKGEPFTGIAREVEAQTELELETVGLSEMVKRAYIRLETASTLFYNGAQDANERGDFEQMDRCIKRFGWLQVAALRAAGQLAQLQAGANDDIIEAALASIKDRGRQ